MSDSDEIGDWLHKLRQYQSLASVYYQLARAHDEACWLQATVNKSVDRARFHAGQAAASAAESSQFSELASDLHTSHYNGAVPRLTRADPWPEHDALRSLHRSQDFARRAEQHRRDATRTLAAAVSDAERGEP